MDVKPFFHVFFIYSQGNCDQYSDLVSPSLQDETGAVAKGKVLVLKEVKDGKSTGIAVACGIHP